MSLSDEWLLQQQGAVDMKGGIGRKIQEGNEWRDKEEVDRDGKPASLHKAVVQKGNSPR